LFTYREASVVADKVEAFSGANIAIVIENSVEYCSEKVIDAIRHGCIPIYVGNQSALDSSLKSLVVSAEPSLASISAALALAKSIDHESWLELAEKALSSPDLWDRVSEHSVLERIASSIRDWANFER
jgi:putative cell wall-binding protein